MFNKYFTVTPEQVKAFRETGFLLLKNFYSQDFITYLQSTISERIAAPTDKYQSGFSRLAFDMYDGDPNVIALLQCERFREVMAELTGRNMFFAQALSFELEKNKNKGFPWHIGTQSFGYHQADDYGATIWSPLCAIDPSTQRGGMAYVPKNRVNGDFLYSHIDPAIFDMLGEKVADGEKVELEEFVNWRDGVLNDPALCSILDYYGVEDAFSPGDALIFDKYTIHRSVMLGDGALNSRTAFVMRFFCSDSTYDKKRAHDLEIPRSYFCYDGPTKFHLAVCNNDGDKLIDSEIFKGQEYRNLTLAQGK